MSSRRMADGAAVFFLAGLAAGAAPAVRAAAFGFAAAGRFGAVVGAVVVAVFLAPSIFSCLLTMAVFFVPCRSTGGESEARSAIPLLP